MKDKPLRYCRVEFRGPKDFPSHRQETVSIDFGYYYQEDKQEGIKSLRNQYKGYSFNRCYSIPVPPPYKK